MSTAAETAAPPPLARAGARVTVVTLGQAPRVDVVPAMADALGERVAVAEAGALDDASDAEIEALAATGDERALVTRLRDGRGVTLGKARLLPRLRAAVERAAASSDAVVVLCSGEFEDFGVPVPVVYPDRVLRGVVGGLLGTGATLGVVSPLATQAAAAPARWGSVAGSVLTAVASPYEDDDALVGAAGTLREARPDLVVLDCMGFAPRHRDLVRDAAGCPVLLPSTCVAAVTGQALA